MDNYTTVQGDTWDMIAFKKLGNEKLMDQLIDVNPEYRDTVFFSADIILNVPQITSNFNRQPKPPWQS